MFNEKDYQKFDKNGISIEEINRQIEIFKKGTKFAPILKPAKVDDGIISLDANSLDEMSLLWEEQKNNYDIVKFVPASGAASRMFKSLFEFYQAYSTNQSPKLFKNKDWGTDTVLTDTLHNLNPDLTSLLPEKNDIDTIDDLSGEELFKPFIK